LESIVELYIVEAMFIQKSFTASHYPQPRLLYGPHLTLDQRFAFQHIKAEQAYLYELQGKYRATKKYVDEQYIDKDIPVPWCTSSDEYYQTGFRYLQKVTEQMNRQEQYVHKLQSFIGIVKL
jgi:hypothetical protein